MAYSVEDAIRKNGQSIPAEMEESIEAADYAIPLGEEVGWAMLGDIYAGEEHRYGVVALTRPEMLLINSTGHDRLTVRVPCRPDVRIELIHVSDDWQALEFTLEGTTVAVAAVPQAIKALRASFSHACSYGKGAEGGISTVRQTKEEWELKNAIRMAHAGQTREKGGGIRYDHDQARRQAARQQPEKVVNLQTPTQRRIAENRANGVACCPKCGSTSLAASKKGYGIGKGLLGAAAVGTVGLIAGGIGKNKVLVTCLNCGHQFKP